MKPSRHILGRLIAAFLWSAQGWTQGLAASPVVHVAAASDLVFCMEDLNHQFTNANPHVSVKTSVGSSGSFFSQIRNGAPFDVFLSADMGYPEDLIKAGAADETSLFQYAVGGLALWTVKTNLALTNGLLALRDPAAKRIAIANPEHAPYGRAARAALHHAGIWDAVQPRLVFGENISQTAQFVQLGHADAGIVSLSLVMSPKLTNTGRWIEIAPESYPPLKQGGVLTRRGMKNQSARDYLKTLQSARAREIFDRHGLRLPPAQKPAR